MVDLGLPGIGGVELVKQLRAGTYEGPIAVASGSEVRLDAFRSMRAGATAFIPKSMKPKMMLTAIEAALAGQVVLPDGYRGGDEVMLTVRQQEVLELLARGHPNKHIASVLNVSGDMVKSHLKSLFAALDARTRTECVAAARARGWL